MSKLQTFEQFLTTSSAYIPAWIFIINLLLATLLAFLLSKIYERFGTSLSNRKIFGKNFIIITMTTMLIISIVKSSLALSLGLVGALSIVRFRAAIKEPEELSYLFLAIAIGLGFGADQLKITLIAFIIISAIIVLKNYKKEKQDNQNLVLAIESHNPNKVDLEKVVEILKQHSPLVNLRRFDESKGTLEATFVVEFSGYENMNRAKQALFDIDHSIKIHFLDNKGIF